MISFPCNFLTRASCAAPSCTKTIGGLATRNRSYLPAISSSLSRFSCERLSRKASIRLDTASASAARGTPEAISPADPNRSAAAVTTFRAFLVARSRPSSCALATYWPKIQLTTCPAGVAYSDKSTDDTMSSPPSFATVSARFSTLPIVALTCVTTFAALSAFAIADSPSAYARISCISRIMLERAGSGDNGCASLSASTTTRRQRVDSTKQSPGLICTSRSPASARRRCRAA